MKLAFGYNKGLAEDVRAAWGARLIVTQDGYTDFLADRTGRFGDESDLDELFGWLDGDKAMATARTKASELLKSYTMSTRDAEHFVLYEDDKGVVVGNTNGSAGYLYVAAWLKAHEAKRYTGNERAWATLSDGNKLALVEVVVRNGVGDEGVRRSWAVEERNAADELVQRRRYETREEGEAWMEEVTA